MPAHFYLFHGDDDLTMSEAVNHMKARMGENGDLNTSEFDGEVASVPEVINAVSSYPFLAEARLVIVRGMIAHVTRKGAGESGKRAFELLLESLPTLPPTARLVLVERAVLAEDHKAVKLAKGDPNGYVKLFKVPQDMASWILKRARDEYEVDLLPAAAHALAGVIGDDLRRADNELTKLAAYVERGQAITEADVAALTPYVAEADLFKMIDAVAEGRGQLALRLMHRLLREKDNNPFGLFTMIVRQFRLMLLAKEFLALGGAMSGLPGALKTGKFPAEKAARQARSFSMEELESIYRRLQQYDQDMKIGKITPELALDLLVSSLAG
jgi:DNA polymerase-3 subunit delta